MGWLQGIQDREGQSSAFLSLLHLHAAVILLMKFLEISPGITVPKKILYWTQPGKMLVPWEQAWQSMQPSSSNRAYSHSPSHVTAYMLKVCRDLPTRLYWAWRLANANYLFSTTGPGSLMCAPATCAENCFFIHPRSRQHSCGDGENCHLAANES
jgi:hypothetical protein